MLMVMRLLVGGGRLVFCWRCEALRTCGGGVETDVGWAERAIAAMAGPYLVQLYDEVLRRTNYLLQRS